MHQNLTDEARDAQIAHLDHIQQLANIYDIVRRRKSADPYLKEQVNALETRIAAELQEFLNG